MKRLRVLVGALLHDRPQVESFLRHLNDLGVSGLEISWEFVLDRVEPSPKWRFPNESNLVPYDLSGPSWTRREGEKPECFARLAAMRNYLVKTALMFEYDALFMADSDVIVPPELLRALVESKQPWVSALVENRPHRHGECRGNAWNVLKVKLENGKPIGIRHFLPIGTNAHGETWPRPDGAGKDLRDSRDMPLLVGAVCLYRREVLEVAEFDIDRRGEDIPFGFDAIRHGFRGWYLPIECEHLMTESMLSAHRKACKLCE